MSMFLMNCSEDDSHLTENTICDELAITDRDKFSNGPTDFISLASAILDGDCLEITYSASGCSGDSWEVKLFDSGEVAESLPVQKFLRLSLKNEEACLAVFMQTKTFDLSPIQLTDETQILLNIDGITNKILYDY